MIIIIGGNKPYRQLCTSIEGEDLFADCSDVLCIGNTPLRVDIATGQILDWDRRLPSVLEQIQFIKESQDE